jgi:hypothetical protein
MTKLALLFALICTCGCLTMRAYSGPRLPKEQVANINRHHYWFGTTLCVDSVDSHENKRYFFNFEVPPGPHDIQLSVSDRRPNLLPLFAPFVCTPLNCWSRYDHYGPVTIKFNAEAGQTYEVGLSKLDDGSWSLWIKDDKQRLLGEGKPGPNPYNTSMQICEAKPGSPS